MKSHQRYCELSRKRNSNVNECVQRYYVFTTVKNFLLLLFTFLRSFYILSTNFQNLDPKQFLRTIYAVFSLAKKKKINK